MTSVAAEYVTLSYWIDSSGTVLKVAGPWDAWLGRDGEVPDRCRELGVVGNSLFSFIESDGVRSIYHAMHARVLETGKTINFPFRCDSPWFRREMQLTISRDRDALRYDSAIIRETRRQRPLPWPTPAGDTLLAMCSVCKAYRFPLESQLWKDIESVFLEPDLPDFFSVTHGLCKPCATMLFHQL